MLFSVVSKKTTRQTHCGVLEFVADEGVIYMPHWVRHRVVPPPPPPPPPEH